METTAAFPSFSKESLVIGVCLLSLVDHGALSIPMKIIITSLVTTIGKSVVQSVQYWYLQILQRQQTQQINCLVSLIPKLVNVNPRLFIRFYFNQRCYDTPTLTFCFDYAVKTVTRYRFNSISLGRHIKVSCHLIFDKIERDVE